jgi:fluoride exporter
VLRIALGGAAGTALRLLALGAVVGAAPQGPFRLLLVNVLGATVLGWVTTRPPVAARWMPALTAGMLGGLTTFSTMVAQAGRLGHDAGALVPGSARMTGAGLVLVSGYLMASITLGLAGFLLGRSAARRTAPAGPARVRP